MSDHFENRLRQLAQEQADAAPSPHPFESVRQRGEHGVELGSGSGAGFGADPGSRPDRRRWFAAAAALVLVVGAVVVVAVRTAEAPTSLSTGDPDAPLTTDPVDRPETTDTDTDTDIDTDPDPDLDPGDDSVYGSSTPTTSVEIPHEVLVDGASVGPVWSTSLANNVAELDELWAELAPGQPVPEVDMETNVVIHFGPAESGSCPFGPLGSVQFDTGSGYLFPELALADPTVDACTDDANPHTIVVAVARVDLPTDDFVIWVDNADPPACCIDDVTRVAAGELAEPPERPDGWFETGFTIQSGDVEVGPDDLFVAHADGDLYLHPGILAPSSTAGAPPIRLVEFGDPREPVSEGPGPNYVEQVAGVHDGAVLYGDCCEPVSGNLLVATGPDSERIVWGAGFTPILSPDRTRLATANSMSVQVIDLDLGRGVGRTPFDQAGGWVNVWDVMWTPDGETIVLLTSDDDGYWLDPFDSRPPLASGDRVPTGISFDAATALPPRLLFAGRGSSGELAVSVTGDDGTTVRFFDPDTLVEREELARPLPAGATSVRLAGDGSSLLWVEGDELWYQPAAEPPRPLGSGYRAAWFAT